MAVDALPGRQEGRQAPLLGRLDLLAQGGQRGAARRRRTSTSHQSRSLPPGSELAADELAGALELAQDGAGVDAVAGAQLVAS